MELCNGTLGDLVELDYKGETIGDKRNILRQIVSGLVHLHNVLQDKVTKVSATFAQYFHIRYNTLHSMYCTIHNVININLYMAGQQTVRSDPP